MRKSTLAILAATALVLSCCVIVVAKAEAAPLQATGNNISSLPYVTDVEQLDSQHFIIQVEVAGNTAGKQLVAKKVNSSKKLRTYQIDQHTWSIEIKKGTRYVLSFNGKAIEYKVRKV